ncbi:MAG: helix-turn-helix domain-containing protein, partial [Planctomycetota bacterium]
PGNVRELRNEVFRAFALSERIILPEVLSSSIRVHSVPRMLPPALDDRPLKVQVKETVEIVERRAIEEALRRANGKKSETAKILGISRPTLDAKLAAYGIKRDGSR